MVGRVCCTAPGTCRQSPLLSRDRESSAQLSGLWRATNIHHPEGISDHRAQRAADMPTQAHSRVHELWPAVTAAIVPGPPGGAAHG